MTEPAASKTENQSSQSGTGWWGLFDKVKQQGANLVNIYKEELTEFAKEIQTDTKQVIEKTSKKQGQEITSQIASGIGGFFGFSSTSTSNAPPKEPEDIPDERPVIVDRHQARILNLQAELSTYCTEPTDLEDFAAWKKEFKIQEETDNISRILSEKEKVREAHTKLVPVAVSYSDFWERYFYKLHKLNQEEEKRAALVKRATTSGQDEEDFKWDEDEEIEVPPASAPQEVEEYFQKLDEEDPKDKPETKTTPAETKEEEAKEMPQEEKEKVKEAVVEQSTQSEQAAAPSVTESPQPVKEETTTPSVEQTPVEQTPSKEPEESKTTAATPAAAPAASNTTATTQDDQWDDWE